MNLLYNAEAALLLYLKGQIVLLPMFILYVCSLRKQISPKVQWKLHKWIIISTLLIPVLFLIPVGSDFSIEKLGRAIFNTGSTSVEMAESPVLRESAEGTAFPEPVDNGPALYVEEPLNAALTESAILTTSAANITGTMEASEEGSAAVESPVNVLKTVSVNRILDIFIILSLFGTLVFLIKIYQQRILEKRIIKKACKIRRAGVVEIIFSREVKAPYTTGLFRKRVFLPVFLLDNALSFRVVIAHEFTHIRRGDLWWIMLERGRGFNEKSEIPAEGIFGYYIFHEKRYLLSNLY
jgi:hypothetical protein